MNIKMGDPIIIVPIKNKFNGKDILSLDQFDIPSLQKLFTITEKFKSSKSKNRFSILSGNLATLIFFEPSSRTFGSFSSAIKRLGGNTIEFQNPLQTSSAVKGETLEDTIKMLDAYSDVIVIRHPEVGSAQRAADAAEKPVINAGDGIGEHPTQALLDIFTLYEQFGSLNKLIGLVAGDLLHGRTVHSLLKGLSLYKNITVYALSPSTLSLSKELHKEFTDGGINLIPIEREKDIPENAHFWYWTRVQKERFKSPALYEKVKSTFTITPSLLEKKGNRKMIIMHPLPRVGEIATTVDTDKRAVYLTRQAQNGVYVRMALVSLVLGKIK